MDQTAHEQSGWLVLHERLITRVRRGVLLMAALVAAAAVDGLGEIQHQKDRYALARQFVRQLPETPRAEAARLYELRCLRPTPDPACRAAHSPDESSSLIVRLEEIPEVGLDYGVFLRSVHPDRALRMWDWELPRPAYTYALLYGPLAMLFVICLRLRSAGRIASKLNREALPGGLIQQRLNSIFSDRVTNRLGEHWLSYSLLWTGVLFLLACAPHMLLLSWQGGWSTNTLVGVSPEGRITLLQEVVRPERVIMTPMSDEEAVEVFLYLSSVAVLLVFVWRVLTDQLRSSRSPRGASKAA